MDTMEELGTGSGNGVYLVAKEDLPLVWPQISRLIEEHPAGLTELFDEQDLYYTVLRTEGFEVWVALEKGVITMAAICDFAKYPRRSFYSVLWIGGKGLKKHFKQGLERLEQRACFLGATVLTFRGRDGWFPLMTKRGYRAQLCMSKPVGTLWRN